MEEKKKALRKLLADLGQEVFTLADMKRILDKAQFLLGLPAAIKVKELVSFLEKYGVISSNQVVMPDGKKVKRFRTGAELEETFLSKSLQCCVTAWAYR
jgi:hypothetical protein